MYRFGMICLLLLVLNVAGAKPPAAAGAAKRAGSAGAKPPAAAKKVNPPADVQGLVEENKRLQKSHDALVTALQTLNSLEAEARVGQTASAFSTCGEMEAYKACDGLRHELKGQATRSGDDMITTYIISTPAYEYCKLKCENMGIPGCCEWSEDHNLCQFIAWADFTVADSGFIRQYHSPSSFEYTKIPTRRASLCTIPNCEYEMALMEQRSGACDWNNWDSNGRMNIPGGGGGHSEKECFDWCTNEPKCVWAALSDIGYCHGYQTCNHQPSGRGFILKQKICKGVWEYSNRNGCTDVRDAKYCLPSGDL